MVYLSAALLMPVHSTVQAELLNMEGLDLIKTGMLNDLL